MLKYGIGLALGLALVAGYLLYPIDPAVSSAAVNWHTYKEGTDMARRQKKSMVIYFHDAAVIDFLNKQTIAIKVDVDHERRIARQFGVRGLPATYLLLNNGEQIGPMPGFIPPRAYLSMLSKILASS